VDESAGFVYCFTERDVRNAVQFNMCTRRMARRRRSSCTDSYETEDEEEEQLEK